MNTTDNTAGDVMVRVRGLSKVFQTRRGEVTALADIDLDVIRGEVLVLLGPSGCGKTTLLRSIAGLEQPTTGEIEVHGRKVFSSAGHLSLPPEKRNLSMVFQSYALWPHMTVAENIAYPLKMQKVAAGETGDRVLKVLQLTGLAPLAVNYPGQLSGGQQQRVALARALVANDGLILFDEPLSNLDAKVRERLRDELIAMQHEFGFTAIYVTHDQVEAAALAHRIAVMEVGRIAQLGRPMDIYTRPQSRYVADFVGCSNELRGKVAALAGDRARVDTPIGAVEGVVTGRAPAVGQEVTVMFRPEAGRIVEGGGEGPNAFAVQVERSIFLGTHIENVLSRDGNRLAIRSMKGEMLAQGQRVTFAVDPRQISVFAD